MIGVLVILCGVLLDQAVKYWAAHTLINGTIVLIPGVFELTYVENRGAAFSILQNHVSLFVVITCVILCAIVYSLYKGLVLTRVGRCALLLVAGGAVGNLIDRIVRGYVVDMFYFKLINFPVFNVADIFVVCGGILFVYYVLIQHDKAAAKRKASSDEVQTDD